VLGAASVMKVVELERLAGERAMRATEVKVWRAKWRAVWAPIMGPVPMMKMVLGIVREKVEGCGLGNVRLR